MGDLELVEAFVNGERDGSVPGLQIQGDVLYVGGWWHAALRVTPDVYVVRAEPPPKPVPVLELLAVALERSGLQAVDGGDNPLINAITYVTADVSGLEWTLWAPDAERGAAAIAHRAGSETAPASGQESDIGVFEGFDAPGEPLTENLPGNYGDISAEFARALLDGMPIPVVLAVGLGEDVVTDLEMLLPSCRIEHRSFDDAIATCGMLKPDLVLVDTAEDRGQRFVLEFRAEACGRVVPVAAVSVDDVPPGADVTLDPRTGPLAWQDQLVALLP
ncbi:MAG TPA: hypothetical protein VM324_07995 [Egibacteraceae bacterium]|nr:hypothetical protein [Egibacteraceae bacterium]